MGSLKNLKHKINTNPPVTLLQHMRHSLWRQTKTHVRMCTLKWVRIQIELQPQSEVYVAEQETGGGVFCAHENSALFMES